MRQGNFAAQIISEIGHDVGQHCLLQHCKMQLGAGEDHFVGPVVGGVEFAGVMHVHVDPHSGRHQQGFSSSFDDRIGGIGGTWREKNIGCTDTSRENISISFHIK
jgi:hypothetical protein